MKRFVFLPFTLILDIGGHGFFTAMLSNRRDIVTVRPKLPAPELFLHLRYSGEDLSCRDTFHDTNDLRRMVGRNRLDEKVDMVFVCSDFEKVNLIPKGERKAYFLQDHVHFLGNHDPAVFGRTDKMVDKDTDVMAFVDIEAHDLQYTSAASRGECTLREIQCGIGKRVYK